MSESPPSDVRQGYSETIPAPFDVKPFIIGQSSSSSDLETSRFRLLNEGVVRSVGAKLSLFLRSEFGFELDGLEAMELGKYTSKAENPGNYLLFQVDLFEGIGMIRFPRPLALAVGDRMLGGRGFGVNPDRELREVELALLNQTVLLALKEYFSHWSEGTDDPRPRIVGRETNPRLLSEGRPEASFYVLNIQASIGDCFSSVDILLPVEMMASSIRRAVVTMSEGAPAEMEAPSERLRWDTAFDDLRLRLTAAWSGLEITPRQILQLKAGDVLPLDSTRLDKVELRIQGLLRFMGKFGSANKKAAVEITTRIP